FDVSSPVVIGLTADVVKHRPKIAGGIVQVERLVVKGAVGQSNEQMISGLLGKCGNYLRGGLAAAAARDVSREPKVVGLELFQQSFGLKTDFRIGGIRSGLEGLAAVRADFGQFAAGVGAVVIRLRVELPLEPGVSNHGF